MFNTSPMRAVVASGPQTVDGGVTTGLFLTAGDQIHMTGHADLLYVRGKPRLGATIAVGRGLQMAVFATLTIGLFLAVFHAANAG